MNADLVTVLTGSSALTVFLVYVVRTLWTAHMRQDEDTIKQRDTAIAGWQAQTAATDRLADALQATGERLKTAASRRRAVP